jgi:UDP-glucose 4-epimerase
MRYLITGGAGFIGSHLCEELMRRGHSVHVLDDLSTGSLDNVRHLADEPAFAYTIESADNAEVVHELVEQTDGVFHLAAAVGVSLIVESPVRTIETNVHCTEVVLTEANREKKPVLLASTSEVYGKSTALPFREDGDMTLGPTHVGRWAYACSKAIDEFLAIAYWKERKLPTVVVRLFNTVGPRQTGRYGMVIPRLVRQALANEPLTVYGDGSQRRCFCHVADVVGALVDLMGCEGAEGEVFNIGGSQETTIMELAARVIDVTDSDSDIALIPFEEVYGEGFEDMIRRIPDTTKISRLIGWQQTRSLDSIIADVVETGRAAGVV